MDTGNIYLGATGNISESNSIYIGGWNTSTINIGNIIGFNQSNNNITFGQNVLFSNTNGNNNIGFGLNALYNNTIGSENIAFGPGSLYNNIDGIFNISLGFETLINNTHGNNNIGLGQYALSNNTTGNFNIGIGLNAGINLISGTGNIYLGMTGNISESNSTYIANILTTTDNGSGVAVYIDSNNKLCVPPPSSIQYKENIQTLTSDVTNLIYQLRPVTFNYKNDNIIKYGLIAEEVAKIYPHLVIYKDNQIESVYYEKLSILLLNELIEHKKLITDLTTRLELLEKK